MTEWTRNHPIATHLINLAITVLFVIAGLCALKYYYGNKIDEVYENTKTIMDIVIKL